MERFEGFSKGFFDFFTELAANNDREWFEENKPRFKAEVQAPLSAFIAAMGPRLRRVSPHFVANPKPSGGSMFRIYRDVRFSKDKRPYKEHAACQFRHEGGRDVHAPGFYVHLAPEEVLFGGGIWLPPAPALGKIRAAIAHDPKGWKKVLADKGFVERFGGLSDADGLKRPPRGYSEDTPHITDIKRKSFFAMHRATMKTAMSPGFADEVGHAFAAASPLMRFLASALDQAF